MGEAGCVGWMFDSKGVFTFEKSKYSEEDLMMVGLEAGIEDITDEDDFLEVHCQPADFEAVREAFEAAEMIPEEAELSMVPQNVIEVDEETGRKLMRLVEMLEDNDDMQNVYANFDLPESLLSEIE